MTLRCTQKLRQRKLGPLTNECDSLVPVLGDWHANLIYVARTPLVICVNDRSLLSVVVPGRDFPQILVTIQRRVVERLKRMSLRADLIANEEAAMGIVEVQPSNSKSVLGSMNDFVHSLKWRRDRFDIAELDSLEERLSQTPMGPLSYESRGSCPRNF